MTSKETAIAGGLAMLDAHFGKGPDTPERRKLRAQYGVEAADRVEAWLADLDGAVVPTDDIEMLLTLARQYDELCKSVDRLRGIVGV